MNKTIAFLLLCTFSLIVTAESFTQVFDNFDCMELYESDSEESEKDLEDLKEGFLVTSDKGGPTSTVFDSENHEMDLFLIRNNSHGEINTPPPELRF